MAHALYGKEPDPAVTSPTVMAIYTMIRPNVENGRKKAKARLGVEEAPVTPVAEEDAGPVTPVADESENKSKDKSKSKSKYKNNSYTPDFDRFWDAYPRKEGRAEAARVFEKVDVSLQVLLAALEAQRKLPQWQQDGGRYIPCAAKWLSGRRWEDTPSVSLPQMGALELQAIERIMAAH